MLCSCPCDRFAVGVGIVSSTFPVSLFSWLFFVHVLFVVFFPECVAVGVGIVSSTLPVVLIGLSSCAYMVFVDRLIASWGFVSI